MKKFFLGILLIDLAVASIIVFANIFMSWWPEAAFELELLAFDGSGGHSGFLVAQSKKTLNGRRFFRYRPPNEVQYRSSSSEDWKVPVEVCKSEISGKTLLMDESNKWWRRVDKGVWEEVAAPASGGAPAVGGGNPASGGADDDGWVRKSQRR